MDNSTVYFEEDYIVRNNRTITSNNDIALTEFVANAWDAGAHNVEITIPYEEHEKIIVEDDGIETFLATLSFSDLTAGRRDGLVSAQMASVDRNALTRLIDHMEAVFDLEPFEKRPLKDLIESSGCVHIVLMKDNNGAGRQRSFYSNNKIYALQQGADNKDKEKAVFLGDSFVIANPNEINIQIHRIVPKKKIDGVTVVQSEFTQYMFAVYIPKEKVYFIKG